MITAKDFCDERLGFEEYGTDVPYFMIEFAKLHVEAALKQANEKAKNCHIDELIDNEVLNAYPLENIK